jgi:hypothetical protein
VVRGKFLPGNFSEPQEFNHEVEKVKEVRKRQKKLGLPLFDFFDFAVILLVK